MLKGYLRCKVKTSQNVQSETEVKIFFILYKNNVPSSRYSKFCIFNHLIIYQICDVMMNISTWDKVHFLIYLNQNSLKSSKAISHYVKIALFHSFENVNKGELSIVNVNYWKWPDLAILSF